MSEDPRRIRTRAALGEALLRRAAEAPFESISVAQLCRDAGVHRTTFYGHAQDVDEFAIEFVTHDLDEVSTVAIPGEATAVDAAQIYLATLVELLVHVAAERRIFRPLLGSRSGAALRDALQRRLHTRVAIALTVFADRGVPGAPDDAHRTEAADAVTGMIVAFVTAWSLSDETDADAAARRLQALMPPWWPIH